MEKNPLLNSVDKDYVSRIYRRLHEYPELGFELPRTLALVRAELAAMGIAFTEEYGQSSIVATINPGRSYTIGIRADMDALPITEANDIPYKSKIAGQMHACGHDGHTAVLLGTAKLLLEQGDRLACTVKLLFQPCEEGLLSGAYLMVEDDVMADIDLVIGMHVETDLFSGQVGVCPEFSMAASRSLKVTFTGRSSHTSQPEKGSDALAMAVKTYSEVQLLLNREISPLERYFCSFNKLVAGTTQNVTAAQAELLGTLRSLSLEVDRHIIKRIRQIADYQASSTGGSAEVWSDLKCLPVYNDPEISASWQKSAAKVVGEENVHLIPLRLSSEDFSQFQRKSPGILWRLGVKNAAIASGNVHNPDFLLDEAALPYGCAVFVQFVLDHMDGHLTPPVKSELEEWMD